MKRTAFLQGLAPAAPTTLFLSALSLAALSLAALAAGPARCAVGAQAAFSVLAAPLAGPGADGTADYVLSPDDQLDVSVLGHDDLKASVTLLPDGTFNYPIVGKVHASGQTIEGLTALLERGLSRQLNQPQVTVMLRQGRARKVSVLGGAAKTPGQYDYRPGMRLLDLIAVSGGPASSPDLAQATLVTDGGTASVPVDLAALLSGADTSQNPLLAPGDVLFLAPRDVSVAQVQVIGEVVKPGSYSVPAEGIPLLSLLIEAGGATPKSALTQAQVMHGGRVTTYNLRALMTRDLSAAVGQVRLVPGDVLQVPVNEAHILAMGEVRSPGVYPIPDGESLPLSVALAQVGGVTPEGDKKNVDVVRRGPDGKATLVAVNTDDLLKGKPGVSDIALRPGDILYVQTRSHPHGVGDVLAALSPLAVLGSLARL